MGKKIKRSKKKHDYSKVVSGRSRIFDLRVTDSGKIVDRILGDKEKMLKVLRKKYL